MDSNFNIPEENATLLIELQGRSENQIQEEIKTVRELVSINQGKTAIKFIKKPN